MAARRLRPIVRAAGPVLLAMLAARLPAAEAQTGTETETETATVTGTATETATGAVELRGDEPGLRLQERTPSMHWWVSRCRLPCLAQPLPTAEYRIAGDEMDPMRLRLQKVPPGSLVKVKAGQRWTAPAGAALMVAGGVSMFLAVTMTLLAGAPHAGEDSSGDRAMRGALFWGGIGGLGGGLALLASGRPSYYVYPPAD